MPIVTKTKWYQAGLRFECTQCGNCCSGDPGYVWVTKDDIRRIAEFLGRSDGALDGKHVRRVAFRYSLTEKPGGDCVFLKRKGGKSTCAVYPVRPLQCRSWPFWTQNLRSPEAWNEVQTKCPGVNRGKHHEFIQIETLRQKKSL